MTTETLFYPSHDGIHKIHAEIRCPEGTPRAIVQIVHGVAEHIGRYDAFAEFLTGQGFIVCGENHLGHGPRTPAEERGFFADNDPWMTVARDTAALSDLVKKKFPGLPFVMFGHSMGSFITRTVYLAGLTALDGVILSGTGNKTKPVIALAQAVARREIRKHGNRAASPQMDRLAFGSYNKRIHDGTGANGWISSVPEEVARYDADPDCGFPVKLGMYLALFEGIGYIIRKENIEKADKTVPVFFVAGTEDPVGAYGKGVKAAFGAMKKAGVKDLSLKLYEGCRHELLNDRAGEEVKRDVLSWMEEHVLQKRR